MARATITVKATVKDAITDIWTDRVTVTVPVTVTACFDLRLALTFIISHHILSYSITLPHDIKG